MPDPEFSFARHAEVQPAAAAMARLGGVACRHCNVDLSLLPAGARFCHRCGVALSEKPARRLTASKPIVYPAAGPAFSRPRWLVNLWCACTEGDDQSQPVIGRSAMLLAYAKSLFNLGWRYEHAVGARRNLNEAARCYSKAARLGDLSATRPPEQR